MNAIQNRHTMVHLRTDGVGYLLIFLAEYHELYTLSLGIHHIVEHKVLYYHRTETEYYLSYCINRSEIWFGIEDEERTAHDEEIHKDEHSSQRDVVIFVDDGGDDVRSTRTTIMQ